MSQPVYWCDACRHECSVFGASYALCDIHGIIYDPLGCKDFERKPIENQEKKQENEQDANKEPHHG